MAGTLYALYICTICRFDDVTLDDVLEGSITPDGRCICLRCYTRETGTTRAVVPWLRRQVEQAAAGPVA